MDFKNIIKNIFLFLCKYKSIIFLILLIIVTYYASMAIFNVLL